MEEIPKIDIVETEYKGQPVIIIAISPTAAEKWRKEYVKGMTEFLIEEPEARAKLERYLLEYPSEKMKEMSSEWLKGIINYIAEKPEWWWERKPGYVDEKLKVAIAESIK